MTSRPRVDGRQHVPRRGPALLVCNDVTDFDRRLVGGCVPRPVRFVSGDDAAAAIDAARRDLRDGHLVCLSVERTLGGGLWSFASVFERITDGLDLPVVPVYLDRVWTSILASRGARARKRATVTFGAPIARATTAAHARLALATLGSDVVARRLPRHETLARQFVRTAKRRWSAFCAADSTGRSLTFGRALVGSLLLARWARRRLAGQTHVGLLLPASVGGALANVGISLAGLVPVNLNFTAGADAMAAAVGRCGIKTTITSRLFLSKVGIEPDDGMVFLEDLLKTFGSLAKLQALVIARLLPARLLMRLYTPDGDPDSVATVIFSSGSTGVPNGVMLTHRNILSNVDAVLQVYQLADDDVLVGVLPFFHSFGFTGTIWLPLVGGFGVVYHPNPTDAKTIGELAGRHRATVLISTPTFCGAYIRKCTPEQFAHLRYAIVGAEKLREPVARAFREKFGLDLLEGYGCTEMAPVVAVNAPDIEGPEPQRRTSGGSVGRPLPGIAAKIVDPNTGEGPLFDREGLMLLRGPNQMKGYLGEPAKTADTLLDGWYATGDIATIDDEGFIRITDRLARFSKIGGEMVPHMKIEQQIQEIIDPQHGCVVTAVPDASKGERLIAFYTDPGVTAQELWERLCQSDLPRLWLPKREDLRIVDAIPTLGTGKVDLRAVRQLAIETTGELANR